MSRPTKPKKYPKHVLDAAVAHYEASEDSIEYTANKFGISPMALTRHRAELGICTLKGHKTDQEHEMINYLRDVHGITSLAGLQAHI